ncbi:MAG TPA: cupin domain-containing protein [Caulobacteraceae bacterium]|jgi:quercetin dioxygenase-like cupin family protein|nr:cupin domain-containing protein [Caulobacteraceae bacterium]
MSQAIIVDEKDVRPLNVVGEKITVLASSAQTGSYEVFHQAGAGGSGPPPHSHPWDEAFFVTRGEIAFGVGEVTTAGRPGTFVHVPAGVTHWFRFGAGGGTMVSVASGGNASRMFTEFDREISPEQPDLAKLVDIAARHGADIPAPPH